ncbi:hypothetical protein TTHERM_00247110 (macronuclear) [Tetrahymena thermophila SB210]|uniref:Uncharacterized protein n=1 Tax=Tetrahymena thermophila (strain SB210) TaxID=312017 RepID=Q245N8_TETTS|nr:hypothetical protein TTHERM_00247110 [Tetrahymena thermophila SB210]EAS03595.1 hypothetical protein TTHERM_00247110 [Tetrahymena thermophila SB210]|eukprot:XP_001023840.1 hypothetical protein TTHERM_00247110 [Tetrahymena thermophila SB210]
MEKQIIPVQLVEKVHQVMNYLNCFASDLQMNDYVTAEEFYLALENMNKHEKFDQLINYIAGTFVMSMFREIKSKNKHQDYLSYEYDFRILKSMRQCFKRIDDNVKTFMEMWRQFLVFFLLVKPFRKTFLIPNYSSTSSIRRAIDEEEDNEDDDEDNQLQENNDQFNIDDDDDDNSRDSSKQNIRNEDGEQLENQSNQSSGEKQKLNFKKKDISKEDQLYEHYYCRSISDTDTLFADFSTTEKLEAFLILVKIAYKFSFCLTYYSNRYKNLVKDEVIKNLKSQITEKEDQRDQAKQQLQELENLLADYTKDIDGDINQLPNDKLQQYKKEKIKLNPLKQKLEKLEKNVSKLNADMILKRRMQFFQFQNWVQLGRDRNKNLFFACVYETSYVFKKIFKLNDQDGQAECFMHQYDNLATLRSEFNLNNIADDQLWDKINQLNRDGILTIPDQKQPIEIEQDQLQDSDSSNMSKKDQISNYYKAKSKLIKQNITTRDFSFIQRPAKKSSNFNSTKKSINTNVDLTVDDLQDFSYSRRVTRSQLSGNKRKKIIIDDDDDEEENEDNQQQNKKSLSNRKKVSYKNESSNSESSQSEEEEF